MSLVLLVARETGWAVEFVDEWVPMAVCLMVQHMYWRAQGVHTEWVTDAWDDETRMSERFETAMRRARDIARAASPGADGHLDEEAFDEVVVVGGDAPLQP